MTEHPYLSEPTSKEAWRQYVANVPPGMPAMPTLAAYRAMSGADRATFNQARQAYLSAFVILRTPAMEEFSRRMRLTMRMNEFAPAGARRGHIVSGEPTMGKSTMVKVFGRDYEIRRRREAPERFEDPYVDYTPVVYVSLDTDVTPKGLSAAIADYLAVPFRSRATEREITQAVVRALRLCRAEVIIFDEIQHMDLARREGQAANTHLKTLANNVAATFVYAGVNVEQTGLLTEGQGSKNTQTAARFTVLRLNDFGAGLNRKTMKVTNEAQREAVVEWQLLIQSFESALCLFKHEPGTLANGQWKYLLHRTHGNISSLAGLLRMAAGVAIDDGTERITRAGLEAIESEHRGEGSGTYDVA